MEIQFGMIIDINLILYNKILLKHKFVNNLISK